MGRTKREDFVADVATTIFINRLKTDNVETHLIAQKSIDDAEKMYDALVERELTK